MHIGGDGAFLQHLQQLFSLSFKQGQGTDGIKSFILDSGLPALQGRILFELDDFLHDARPIALADHRINRHQIGAGNLQINGRLLM